MEILHTHQCLISVSIWRPLFWRKLLFELTEIKTMSNFQKHACQNAIVKILDQKTNRIELFCIIFRKSRVIWRSLMLVVWDTTSQICPELNAKEIKIPYDVYVCKYVICLPTEHQGVHQNSFRNVPAFQDRIGIWKCWFLRRRENRSTGEKPLEAE